MAKERKPKTYDRHHRLPRSRGGSNQPSNISIVERAQHQAWHLLVGNMTASEAAAMLTDTWIDPDYYLVAVPRKRICSKKRRTRRYCVDCECEVMRHIKKVEKER